MKTLKPFLVSLILTISFSLAAQEATNNKKEERQEKRAEKKELREERKEERRAKKNRSVDVTNPNIDSASPEVTESTIQYEPQTEIDAVDTNDSEEIISTANNDNEQTSLDTHQEAATPVNTKTNNTTVTAQQNTNQTSISTPSATNTDDPEEDTDFGPLVILILIGVGIYKIIKFLFARRCSSCKRRFSMRVVNEEFLGHTKKTREKGSDGKYYDVYYSKIKVTRQCKHCGHQDFYIEERKGEI